MSKKLCKRVINGSTHQEITMRDVLGGLEEIVSMLSYDPWPGDFEIIAIYPPDEEKNEPQREKTVIKSITVNKTNIISYKAAKAQQLKSA